MAVVTFLTRALPFLLFGRGGKPPEVVLYLGPKMDPAIQYRWSSRAMAK